MKFATLMVADQEIVAAVDTARDLFVPLKGAMGTALRSMHELINDRDTIAQQLDWSQALPGPWQGTSGCSDPAPPQCFLRGSQLQRARPRIREERLG